jgi:two-component system response regulator AdeR
MDIATSDDGLRGARVMIVEDEPEIADILDAFFAREGADRLVCRDGEDALASARWWRPDVMILDLKLPKRDGLSVLAELRATHPSPRVIVLSALGEDIDKMAGFRLGCDDYVVKPFNPLEVVARARAVIRRQNAEPSRQVLTFAGVRIDLEAHRAFLGTNSLDLTPVEFKLLRLLVERAGRLVTRGQLVEAALDDDAFDRSVDPHISRMRQKLDGHADAGVRVASIRGEGYRLDPIP